MATRLEVEQRRNALRMEVRRACAEGVFKAGALVPSLRALADQYALSTNAARQALQELVQDGTLYTVPGVGVFAGRKQTPVAEYFLHVTEKEEADDPDGSDTGFAERIALRGGATLALPLTLARDCLQRGELPEIAGIFGPVLQPGQRAIPYVTVAGQVADVDLDFSDTVSYDDRDGGRQAAQHLLGPGHRVIAFLGLHTPTQHSPSYEWSAEREAGWRSALEDAGLSSEGLAFHPSEEPGSSARRWIKAGRAVSRMLVARPDITAVVAASDYAALGLLDTLKAADIPVERWPAIVGFGSLPSPQGQIISSLSLPADRLGCAAADILWERARGILAGPPVHRKVKLSLLPRVTSRAGWAILMGSWRRMAG